MDGLWQHFLDLMHRGGFVMWPLLGLSVIAVTLVLERCWFFVRINHPARLRRVARMTQMLRTGDHQRAKQIADQDESVYGDVVVRLFAEPVSEASVYEAVEAQRQRLERFMPTLSTIITAAPMLGILGTVLGIISSFEVLSVKMSSGDPRAVSAGIAEALITTAAGLVVAVAALFPYNAFRAQVDRTLTRLESIGSAVLSGSGKASAEVEAGAKAGQTSEASG